MTDRINASESFRILLEEKDHWEASQDCVALSCNRSRDLLEALDGFQLAEDPLNGLDIQRLGDQVSLKVQELREALSTWLAEVPKFVRPDS